MRIVILYSGGNVMQITIQSVYKIGDYVDTSTGRVRITKIRLTETCDCQYSFQYLIEAADFTREWVDECVLPGTEVEEDEML